MPKIGKAFKKLKIIKNYNFRTVDPAILNYFGKEQFGLYFKFGDLGKYNTLVNTCKSPRSYRHTHSPCYTYGTKRWQNE